ncbi:Thiolase, N-terminal domain-containing protein [Auriculariales sp. MPI-PUGE-AT-0066]|nr:Thiolase, N-terminal domain-containing protein [Auriculariales sp. MPI-PUGE-AT-0066]
MFNTLRVRAVTSARRYAHSAAASRLLEKRADDVVITFAKRTAIGRAKKGQLKDTSVDELLSALFKATLAETKLDPAKVDDICVGTCHPPSPLYVSRAAALAAGIPATVPVSTVNRLCSSGLMAIRSIVNDIRVGEAKLGIAIGVESMSLHPRPTPQVSATVVGNKQADDCIQPMGWTSEMVAQNFDISREKQDEYAIRSHDRAIHAIQSGVFADEILSLRIGDLVLEKDDTVRPGVTLEGLAALKPAFADWGNASTTAGNASGLGDGAAILIITTRANADAQGLPVVAKWGGCAVVGVEPRYMGIGPAVAIPKLLNATGLHKDDVHVWEINEAFASQFAYCVEQLDLPMRNVNPQGGSIALSHPLGMTGARLPVTGLAELRRRGEHILCTSMCIGSGMGAAAIFVNEQY